MRTMIRIRKESSPGTKQKCDKLKVKKYKQVGNRSQNGSQS